MSESVLFFPKAVLFSVLLKSPGSTARNLCSTGKFKHRLSGFVDYSKTKYDKKASYITTRLIVLSALFCTWEPKSSFILMSVVLMAVNQVRCMRFHVSCIDLTYFIWVVQRGNAQLLIFCWPLPQLVKIDVTTFEINMTYHSQDITKSSFNN